MQCTHADLSLRMMLALKRITSRNLHALPCRFISRLQAPQPCWLNAQVQMRLMCNAMLRQACVLCPKISAGAGRVQYCRCSAARHYNSDRSYPPEPRVGVGVVILRPSPDTARTVEVHALRGIVKQASCANAFCECLKQADRRLPRRFC